MSTAWTRKDLLTIRELDRAVEENSTMLYILDVDPKLDSLRGDPRFPPLREKLFAGAPTSSVWLRSSKTDRS